MVVEAEGPELKRNESDRSLGATASIGDDDVDETADGAVSAGGRKAVDCGIADELLTSLS